MGIFGYGVVAALGGLAYVISRRPDSFRISRSIVIAARPAAIFGYVNDFHRWRAWSPWEELDPQLKRTYSGSDAGVGASYAWEGNSKAGSGTMTIVESTPAQRIEIRLEFLRPMKATNTSEFQFEPVEDGVRVTWSMHGKYDFMGKAFALFVDTDKLLGKSFEDGLAKLAHVAKTAGAPEPLGAGA